MLALAAVVPTKHSTRRWQSTDVIHRQKEN
jgi:hypothetical protein